MLYSVEIFTSHKNEYSEICGNTIVYGCFRGFFIC